MLGKQFDVWDYNVFKLHEAAATAPFGPVTLAGVKLFMRRGFIQEFHLDPIRLLNTFRMLFAHIRKTFTVAFYEKKFCCPIL